MIPFQSPAPCSIGIQTEQGIVVSERATRVGGGTLKPPDRFESDRIMGANEPRVQIWKV